MKDVKQIKVNGHQVGIRGLDQALEELAPAYAPEREQELAERLLARVRRENYIPDPARQAYAEALRDMLRKAVGLEPLAQATGGLSIQVACGGCAGGERVLQAVYDALTRLGITGEVERVSDALEIAALGLRGTPALVVNGEVKAVGSIPPDGQIEEWLREAAGSAIQKA
ncbi:MAG: thioredoxin family protein [Desulfarculaceae bacterium]|nr:thioredoxin family protein [Desulfarculaceae bacterium]MCF8048222.1 thioredoxin family protein [Desulfarculaceae bacterium]MCF8066685.1 thioredoxin family protein [Desulfarculaceae bacterium]MCF8097849.1 thioredoxin family protein [Desulfarculaceae bacterium]MCF8122809.1 thioredoxin family protein [Desulfarculaceae bacterium]